MKKTLLVPIALSLLTACLSLSAHAQETRTAADEGRQQSNTEKFLARSGTLIEKTFLPLGTIPASRESVKVQLLTVTDVLTKSSFSGVRFEKTISSTVSQRTSVAFLDADEVDALLSSLAHFKTLVDTKRDTYTEVEYRSRGGFTAGCFYQKESWTFFVRLSQYDSASSAHFGTEALFSLQDMLQQAKSKIKALK